MLSDETKREIFDRRGRHQVLVVNDESMLTESRLSLQTIEKTVLFYGDASIAEDSYPRSSLRAL